MPWIVGVDEAGYGPNLGPFVMTSVACRVPEELAGADLWQVLRPGVRRHKEADDGRPMVDDSKLVYSTASGLAELEKSVLATLSPWRAGDALILSQCLDWLCPAGHAEVRSEVWYTGASSLPAAADPETCRQSAERFAEASHGKVAWGLVRSVVVCPARFNQLLDQWGSKGAVLSQALVELLECNCAVADGEPIAFFIDKHGGRNSYAAVLQPAFPDGFVVAHEEGRERSVYSVLGGPRSVQLTAQPRADSAHLCVALASLVSKYLRELLMKEFNHFWQAQVPGLEPTAGYPGDAVRFFEAIRPALPRLGLAEAALWRRK
jgi:hypothetical protein